MSPIPRYILSIFSALILGLTVLVVVGFLRLQQGPISVAFLSPYLQEALQLNSSVEVDLSFDDCVLNWRGFEKGLNISVIGVRVLDKNERIIATLPEISLELEGRSLAVGKLGLRSVNIVRPLVRFSRKLDGAFDFGVGESSNTEPVSNIFSALAPQIYPGESKSPLQRVTVTDATVFIKDDVTGLLWRSRNADISIILDNIGLSADFDADIDLGDQEVPVSISSRYNYEQKIVDIGIDFSRLPPQAIAPVLPQLSTLSRIDMLLTGGVSFRVGGEGDVISSIGFKVEGREGSLDLQPLLPKALDLTRIEATGDIDPIGEMVVFSNLQLASGTAKFEATGSLSATDGASIKLIGRVWDWTANDLERLWPTSLLPPVRNWYVSSISDGLITDGKVQLDFSSGEVERKKLRTEAIDVKISVTDVNVKYLKSMPEFVSGEGIIHLTPHSFEVLVDSGQIDAVPISDGLLTMTLEAPRVWRADLEFVGIGENRDVLRLINEEPLRFADKLKIDSKTLSGVSASRVRLRFPVRRDLTLDRVEFAAASNLHDLSIPQIVEGFDLTDGRMALEVTASLLEVKGTGNLNSVPTKIHWKQQLGAINEAQVRVQGNWDQTQLSSLGFDVGEVLSGNVLVDLNATTAGRKLDRANVSIDLTEAIISIDPLLWKKEAGVAGSLNFNFKKLSNGGMQFENALLQTDGLYTEGILELLADGKLSRLDLSRVVFGQNEVSISARSRQPEGYIIAVNGQKIDLEPFIESFFESSKENRLPVFTVAAKVQEVRLSQTRTLYGATGELFYDGTSVRSLSASGAINGLYPFDAQIITTNSGERSVSLSSSNAGGLAKTTGLFKDAEGGSLLVNASLEETELGPIMEGRMAISNIRLTNVPSLARLLSLASLSGIIEVLNGEGIMFVRVDIPFRYDGGVLRIKNARAFGPSLGINIDGEIDGLINEVAIFGTLVPAYTINAVLGQIPLIGPLLVGREGEGVFALTFGMQGDLDAPSITVNPLLSLAPGFLRSFFSGFTTDPNPPRPEDQQGQDVPG